MQKHLYTFCWSGRSGIIEGLFVAKDYDIENLVGKEVDFGEVLGKHSHVHGIIEDGDIEVVPVDTQTVEKLEAIMGETWSGYNPIYFICDQEDS